MALGRAGVEVAGDEHAVGGSLVAAVEAYDDAVVEQGEGGGHGGGLPGRGSEPARDRT